MQSSRRKRASAKKAGQAIRDNVAILADDDELEFAEDDPRVVAHASLMAAFAVNQELAEKTKASTALGIPNWDDFHTNKKFIFCEQALLEIVDGDLPTRVGQHGLDLFQEEDL